MSTERCKCGKRDLAGLSGNSVTDDSGAWVHYRERCYQLSSNPVTYCCGNDDKCFGGCDCQCHKLTAEIERLRAQNAAMGLHMQDYHRLHDELERLRAALCMLYDKWENGDGCSDEGGVFLGNAFRLTQAEEDQVLALIPAERAADETDAGT